MSFGMIIMCFTCMVQRFTCFKSPTRNISPASWSAFMARSCTFKSFHLACINSLTSLWNGSFLIKSSVKDWNFFISFRAFMPLLFFIASYFPSSSFLFISSTLFTLFTFTSHTFFNSALVRVLFVFQAISIKKKHISYEHIHPYPKPLTCC